MLHGASDPVFSVNDTLRWAERLQHNLGLAPANQVARVFSVPAPAVVVGSAVWSET